MIDIKIYKNINLFISIKIQWLHPDKFSCVNFDNNKKLILKTIYKYMIDPNVVDKSGNTKLQRGALKALLSSLKNMLFSPCIIWSRLQQCFMPCWWSGSASCHVRSYSKEEKKEEKIPFLLFVLHSMVQIAVMFHAMLAGGNMSCHVRSH